MDISKTITDIIRKFDNIQGKDFYTAWT